MSVESRHYSLGPDEGRALMVLGDVVTLKVTAEETGGAYLLTEIRSVPGGGPAFLHTHGPQESFWILEGEYEVYGQDANGEKYAIEATAGFALHVPGNVPHGFRNVGTTEGRVLTMYAPVSPQQEFFIDIGVDMASALDPIPMDQMPSLERITEVLERYHMQLLEDPSGG